MNYLTTLFEGLYKIKPSSLTFILALIVLSFIFYYFMVKRDKNSFTPRVLVYASICIAMSFVLSYIKIYHWPQGGSITLASMLPLMIFAYIFGAGRGIMAGFVYSILQLIQDMYVVHWAQLLFDYPFAFAAIGLAGLAKNNLGLGVLIGGFGRFFFHFMSGVIFFGSYAPEGQGAVLYSFIVNITLIGTDTLICFIVSLLPPLKSAIDKLRSNLIKTNI